MHEPIFHPGLHFYVNRLSGTLRYTLSRAGRAPKQFELSEADFEDTDLEIESEGAASLQGTEASAVGLQIKLIKNDGVLNMEFEGRNGGSAQWRFVGTEEQGGMMSMIGTQTEAPTMVENGVQTSKAEMTEAKVQTDPDWTDLWPRYLFMNGIRNAHTVLSNIRGTLHIDRKEGRVRWHDIVPGYDSKSRPRKVLETIDLCNRSLEVNLVESHAGRKGPHHQEYIRISGKGYTVDDAFTIGVDEDTQMWANNDERMTSTLTTFFMDTEIMVEEIKRCIDKTTGRPCSVPRPKTKSMFRPIQVEKVQLKRKEDQRPTEASASKKARSGNGKTTTFGSGPYGKPIHASTKRNSAYGRRQFFPDDSNEDDFDLLDGNFDDLLS